MAEQWTKNRPQKQDNKHINSDINCFKKKNSDKNCENSTNLGIRHWKYMNNSVGSLQNSGAAKAFVWIGNQISV